MPDMVYTTGDKSRASRATASLSSIPKSHVRRPSLAVSVSVSWLQAGGLKQEAGQKSAPPRPRPSFNPI